MGFTFMLWAYRYRIAYPSTAASIQERSRTRKHTVYSISWFTCVRHISTIRDTHVLEHTVTLQIYLLYLLLIQMKSIMSTKRGVEDDD